MKNFKENEVLNMNNLDIIEYSMWDGSIPATIINMPINKYHLHDSISNSGLSLISRSPAHYKYSNTFKSTRAQEIGTAFHTALFEPKRFENEYFISNANDRRLTEYKNLVKIYGNEKTLTENEGNCVSFMLESIKKNKFVNDLFKKTGFSEISMFVKDPETGMIIRCRFDWLSDDGIAVDLKKTQDCRDFSFSKTIHMYRYHCQAAMYSHIYKLMTGKELKSFKFLAVEENPPCSNILYDIEYSSIQLGYIEYRNSLMKYAESKKSGCWETYSGEGIIGLPEWVLNSHENMMVQL